jgi:uncharacterized protein (TIGR02001 family)
MVPDTFRAGRPEEVPVVFLKRCPSPFQAKAGPMSEKVFVTFCRWRALGLGAVPLLAAAALVPATPGTAAAAEYRASAQLRLTSDYVYRRYSKSADRPTAQLNINLSDSRGAFLGAWLSHVEMDEARFEANPYAGIGIDLAPRWRLDAVAEGYLYDGEIRRWDPHYAQLYTALHYDEWLTARLAWALDAYGSGQDIVDAELSARYPVTDVLEVGAVLGYEHFPDEVDYGGAYGGAGLTYYPSRHVALGLRYHAAEHAERERRGRDVDFSIVPNPIESRVEFSISLAW